jgi:hypothetical protein
MMAPAFVVVMGVDATRALGVDDDVEVAVKSCTNLGASMRTLLVALNY